MQGRGCASLSPPGAAAYTECLITRATAISAAVVSERASEHLYFLLSEHLLLPTFVSCAISNMVMLRTAPESPLCMNTHCVMYVRLILQGGVFTASTPLPVRIYNAHI